MLCSHFTLSKTRLDTLVVLIVGLVNTRTVNLSHLASQFLGDALQASNYRRLQRFFQYVRLDGDLLARLMVRMLNLERPKMLALDRTNWKLGNRDINILGLAIVTRRFRVPLLWTLLDHQGNSDTAQRVALTRRYLALYDASSIKLLLADREFIGTQWMEFLCNNNIPFAIHLREGLQLRLDDGRLLSFRTLMRRQHSSRTVSQCSGWLNGMAQAPRNRLSVAMRRIRGGEALIVVTNTDTPARALNAYRRQWSIECLFADAKTREFNIEDTHIVDTAKISTLLGIVALAITRAYRCATNSLGLKAIRRKAHGRREKSWFRTGLDTLRNWIIHDPGKALKAWAEKCPKRPLTPIKNS